MHRALALAAVVLTLWACKKKDEQQAAATDLGPLLIALPGNASAVVGAQMPLIAASPLWDLFRAVLGDGADDLDGMVDGCGVDPKEVLDTVAVSIPGSMDPMGVAVAARTRIDRSRVADCAVALGEAHGVGVRVQDEGPLSAYHQGEGGAEYLAWPDSDLAVLVPTQSSDPLALKEMLDEPDRAASNQALARLADEVDARAALWAIADLSPGSPLAEAIGGMPVADKPVAAHAGVWLDAGARIRVGFRFSSAHAAKAAAEFLDVQLRGLGRRNAAAAPYLESLEVTTSEQDAVATVRLTEEQVRELVAMLRDLPISARR